MDAREFHPYSGSHWLALVAILATGAALLRWFRNPATPPAAKLRVRKILAGILCLAVALDPVLVWLRHHDQPATAWQLVLLTALPLYLCDVVSLLLAWALVTGNRRVAEVGYFWSLAATTQGLLTPALVYGWHSPEFYAFFAQHGGAPVAGVVLAFGAGMPPQPGYFKRMLWWSWGYMASVFLLNLLLGANYGFINGKPETASLLDHLGPWPWYLIPLQLIGFSFFFALGKLAEFLLRRFPQPAPIS
jgi:hypothetical integral membrane protein (TIGR02206 family)